MKTVQAVPKPSFNDWARMIKQEILNTNYNTKKNETNRKNLHR